MTLASVLPPRIDEVCRGLKHDPACSHGFRKDLVSTSLQRRSWPSQDEFRKCVTFLYTFIGPDLDRGVLEGNTGSILPRLTMVVDQAPIIKRIPVPPVEHQKHHYVGSIPSQQVLKAGTVLNAGHRALASDLLLEQDVAIRMRDGVTLYADVYRPPGAKAGTVPAIIAGGPFGKTGGPNKANFNRWPWRHGCPRSATTGLEKFEGPDPGYWCYHGYAVVHTGRLCVRLILGLH